MDLNQIIRACKRDDRKSQKQLYDHYAPLFMSICLRYLKNREDAEDVLVHSFYKILANLHKYSGRGSFEGWMKKLLVNECLMFLRKHNNFHLSIENAHFIAADEISITDKLGYEDLVACLDQLPPGYRTVFNLYVIEGYKHKEIAKQLGISINTSKSQLILAKKRMKSIIKKKQRFSA